MFVGHRCNLGVGKSDEHTKTITGFTKTKVYLLLHLVVAGEKEAVKTESTALIEQRET